MRKLAVCTCALFAAVAVGIAFGHQWTDSTGKFKIDADFVALDSGQVTLKKSDGSTLRIPLDRLSKADQDESQKLAAKQNPQAADKTENPFVPLPATPASGKTPASRADAPKPAAAETTKLDSLIKIERARWGGGNNWADVTQRVQEAVDHHESVLASADFLKKDPTPGWRKHLQITFKKDGHHRTVRIDEGQQWSVEQYEGDVQPGKIASDRNHSASPTNVATKNNEPSQAAGQPTAPDQTPQQRGETEVSLPSNVSNVAVGGAGRFLILHLSQVRKLAIFDVKEAKIVKYIPLPEDEVCITAGIDKLIVGLPLANAFQRWSLQTMEREVTVPNPLNGVISDVVMGSASTGPLLVNCAGTNSLLTPQTFRELSIKTAEQRLSGGAPGLIRASADGTLFAMREGRGGEGHTMGRILVHGDFVSLKSTWMSASLLIPSHDARYVYSGDGVYSPDLTRLYPKQESRSGQHYMPADEGDLILHLVNDKGESPGRRHGGQQTTDSPGDVEIMLPGQYRPICTVHQVPGVVHDNLNYGGNANDRMQSDKRLHLIPRAKLLVSIPTTNDKLVLRRFDLDELLAESETDYLFVVSMPPLQARPGEVYKYELEVKSRKGGVKTKLESGPEGMKLSADGKLAWTIPHAPAEQTVGVIVSVSDSTGQEIFQDFRIQVGRKEDAGNMATVGESANNSPRRPILPSGRGNTPTPIPIAESHELVSAGKFRLTGSSGPLAVVPGRDAKSLLVLQQDRLAILGPDGITIQKQVKLPKKYTFLAEREKYYVAIAAEPQSIDLIDKTSLTVSKSLKLPGMGATDLALHPTKPLAYVAYKAGVEIPRFRFMLFDEKSGDAHELDHCIGKWLQVSPDGSFLIAGYSDLYERGQQLVVNPGQMFFVPEYGNIDWLIRYDLKDPEAPEGIEKQDKAGGNGGGLRMSADGKRVTYLSHVGYPMYSNNLGGWDPTDLHKLPASYGTKDVATPLELAYHPVLPLVASFGKLTAIVFDRETGDVQPDRVKLLDDEQLAGNIQRIYFTPDGRHLLFDAVVNQIHYLVQAELKLTPAEVKQLANPRLAPPKAEKKPKTA